MVESRRGRGVGFGMGARSAILALGMIVFIVWTAPARGSGQVSPAGLTGAVLSFIDAAAGRLEVVRHWPEAPVDVDILPFVPYFWTGCPGPGAIMILVTAAWSPLDFRDRDRTHAVGLRLSETIRTALRGDISEPAELWRLVAAARTPGDPILEAVKALIPVVADLGTYERRGYAVFAFVTWQGWRCGVTLRVVPEGYGIPFVR